jgi:hypothetical protein
MIIRDLYNRRRAVVAALSIPLGVFLLQLPLEARPLPQEKPVVRNVSLEISQEIAIITYDLVAQSGETYEVVASLVKEGDPNFRVPVKSATGDIGRGKFAGLQRRIQWDWKKDLPKDFTGGPEYSIEVTATRVEEGGGGSWVYYVLGGVLIAGGAAALAGGGGGGETPSTPSSSALPGNPPGRPF